MSDAEATADDVDRAHGVGFSLRHAHGNLLGLDRPDRLCVSGFWGPRMMLFCYRVGVTVSDAVKRLCYARDYVPLHERDVADGRVCC